jgi:endonuclease/exonuclease/phosphatase family metal-dependent hydrolase
MRIGTWNVEYARGLTHNARRQVRLQQADADIWILTETHDDLTPGEDWQAVSSDTRRGADPGGRWVTIWTRLPLIKALDVTDADRTAACLVEAPTGPLIVFGTVLPWHADRGEIPTTPPSRNWQEQYRVIPDQAADWRRLQAAFPQAALCVAGDLNMNLGGPQYYGTATGRTLLADAMAASGLKAATAFDCVPAGLLEHPMIDHVLLPQAWMAAARVAHAWEGTSPSDGKLSDHSGAVVEVSD